MPPPRRHATLPHDDDAAARTLRVAADTCSAPCHRVARCRRSRVRTAPNKDARQRRKTFASATSCAFDDAPIATFRLRVAQPHALLPSTASAPASFAAAFAVVASVDAAYSRPSSPLMYQSFDAKMFER